MTDEFFDEGNEVCWQQFKQIILPVTRPNFIECVHVFLMFLGSELKNVYELQHVPITFMYMFRNDPIVCGLFGCCQVFDSLTRYCLVNNA